MFYREFLKITNLFDEHFVDTFDFWLTTLPDREARTISVSTVASRLEVKYSVAESIMGFAEKEKITLKIFCIKSSKQVKNS